MAKPIPREPPGHQRRFPARNPGASILHIQYRRKGIQPQLDGVRDGFPIFPAIGASARPGVRASRRPVERRHVNVRHRVKQFSCTAALVALCVAASLASQTGAIDPSTFLEHVKFLSSSRLQGRGNGTPGLARAGDYIAARFQSDKLEPGGEGRTYFQSFEVVTGLQVGSGNTLSLSTPSGAVAFQLGRDYYPVSVDAGSPARDSATPGPGSGRPTMPPPASARPPSAGASDALRVPVVFAGYGISAPGLNYDDYAGVDVTGKAVLIFTDEPQENDASSPFDGKANTTHATVMTKAMVARSHGARLVLLVEDMAHATDQANYAGFLQDPQADEYGIPAVRVARDRVDQAIAGSLDLRQVAGEIDRDLKPRSRILDSVSVSLAERFAKTRRPDRNVVGILRGSDPARAAEAVVVGAHYDHLGLGGRHSLAPSATGQIHPGADDNASGIAALLEMARLAAADRVHYARTVVFAAFAGEELGLLGSAYYVDHPAVPLDRTVAMIDLDMIGRPSGRVLISGLESAPSLQEDLKAAEAGSALQVKTFGEGALVGASDDTSFLLRRVPSIAFFSGFHADYHRPSDTWEKIDPAGAAEVTKIAFALLGRIANRSDRPEFVATARPAQSAGGGPSGGYGAYFGSVPDFAESDNGVRFADVRDGSPAALAGLRRGDVLTSFDGKPVKTLYDFTYALQSKRPGDRVEVIVLRDGQEVKASVELGNRR
jgi:hypothetical protein